MKRVTTGGFDLTQDGIYRTSEAITELLADADIDSKEVIHLQLLAEETLLKYKDRFDEDTQVSIRFSEFLGKVKLTLSIRCECYDPFAGEENSMNALMRSMLINTETVDEVWRYREGVTTSDSPSPKKGE